MPSYIGDYGIVYVRTDTTNVLQLPLSWTLVTGVAAPAAAPGAKTFAAKGRCWARGTLRSLSTRNHELSSLLISTSNSSLVSLRTGRAEMSGTLVDIVHGFRCQLTTNYPPGNINVHFDGLLAAKSSLVNCELTRTAAFKFLDGTLTAHSSFPVANLRSVPGVTVDGVLSCTTTWINDYPFGELFIAGRMETRIRISNRSTMELTVGDTHFVSSTMQCHSTATLPRMGTHPAALLASHVTAQGSLNYHHRVSGLLASTTSITPDLQVLRHFQLSATAHVTGTARLTLDLQGQLSAHSTLTSFLDVQRYLTGTLSAHATPQVSLRVLRLLTAQLTGQATADVELDVQRLFFLQGYANATASASLQSDRHMSAVLLCHGAAYMTLIPVREHVPPVGDSLFVSPDLEPSTIPVLPVQVEELYDNAFVDEDA